MISEDVFSLTDAEQVRFAEVQRLTASGENSIKSLLDMLTDASWVVRRSVIDSLANLGDAAVPSLVSLLQTHRDSETRIAAVVDVLAGSKGSVEKSMGELSANPDPAIVADVAQILGRRLSPTAVPVLIKLTTHANDNVAVGSIEALGRIGGRAAVEALIQIVSGRNFFRVFPAIDVLGRSGDPRAVQPLIALLSDPMYLPEAARALGRTGEVSAIAPLADLLLTGSDSVTRIAASSLWELRERYQEKAGGDLIVFESLLRTRFKKEMVRKLGRVLPRSDASEATSICSLLGGIGDPEGAPYLALALDEDGPVAKSAAISLKQISHDSETTLLDAIKGGSCERRKLLLPLVSRSSAAVETANCLSDSDPEVRALACDTLARLGNTTVVGRIFPLLEDQNLRVVHAATAAIQALGSNETRQLAIRSADSVNPVVRRSALRILSNLGDVSALKPLLKGLEDPDLRVREAAVQGLPFVEHTDALEALYRVAQSDAPKTRALAMRSFGQLHEGSEQVFSILMKGLTDADPWTRYYSGQSLGRLKHTPASSAIAALLNDPAGQVRVAAVEALSHLDTPLAHEPLRLAIDSEDLEVRRASLIGLGLIRKNEDLPLLLAASSSADTATRLIALSAVAKFDSDRVVSALSSAASDSDEQVSTSAVTFLGNRREPEATEVLVGFLSVPALAQRVKAALLIPTEGRTSGLLVALEYADHELAAVLISILSRLQRPEARIALLAAMKSNNVAARKAAAPALAARHDSEMKIALQDAAANDPDQEVKQICLLLLRL